MNGVIESLIKVILNPHFSVLGGFKIDVVDPVYVFPEGVVFKIIDNQESVFCTDAEMVFIVKNRGL